METAGKSKFWGMFSPPPVYVESERAPPEGKQKTEIKETSQSRN